MNNDIFFNAIRANPFDGSMRQAQVDGVLATLAACERNGVSDNRHIAYILATKFHETGPASHADHMQPVTERGPKAYFAKYEPGTKIGKRLGNTLKGDGYRFRGRGDVQLTGRANYEKAGKKLMVDLVADPDRALEPAIAADICVIGMRDGWFTGRRLSNFFNAATTDWFEARTIVNGHDKATQIADYAVAFREALQAAMVPDVPKPDVSQTRPTGFIARLIALMMQLLKGLRT